MVLLIIEGYEKAEHSVEKAPKFTVAVVEQAGGAAAKHSTRRTSVKKCVDSI
jgi:hypothetical protein